MRINFTDQALDCLEERLAFLLDIRHIPTEKVEEIRARLFASVKSLLSHPNIGQKEERLSYLKSNHRRLIEGDFKIIYRVDKDVIHITDFFDTREDPKKMKG